MKKRNTLLVLLFFVLAQFSLSAQDNQIPQSFSEVVSADSTSKSVLYSNAKKWILSKFMTADNMMEFNDKDSSFIIATAHILMGKKKYLWGWQGWVVNTDNNILTFKLELNFKDNRFKYDIMNLTYSYDRNGAAAIYGHEEGPLNKIEGMPEKKAKEVQDEAVTKMKILIEEMKTNIKVVKSNSDW